jgi:hypothetical protein
MINGQGKLKQILVALCFVGTLLILSWLLRYAHYGFDFTDESFYLVWIANPFLYDGSLTQFGFVYHPLYGLLGGDIAGLRQANILITFGLAWVLTFVYLDSLAPSVKENPITLFAVSAGLATSALIYFDSWLPTPSYNSLALQSLLVSAIGLVLAEKGKHRASAIGWLLIGFGGWLAFMAKPSTALALAVSVFIYLLLARKFSIRMLALTVACALTLLLISALMIDGSIISFINRFKLGIEFSGLLGGGYALSEILRIDEFQLSEQFKLAIFLLSGALILALCSLSAKSKKWSFIGLLIPITFFTLTALLTLGQIYRIAELGQFQGLLIFAVVYAVAITTLVLGRLRALMTISLSQWTIAALFLVMPHIYAFGTNGNYWRAGGSAAIFWLLAGLVLLGPLIRERASWLLALPLALAAQAVTATLLQTGLEQPYRQPQPLRINISTLEIGPERSALTLSEGYSAYIASAMVIAKKAGFEPNMPLIDLSGQSPGVLYAIGAENIGQAWTIGGYSGSLKLAETALARTSCEKISTAWILVEPGGPRSIPTELMLSLGADFPSSFKHIGAWQTAEGAGGYLDRRTQELYKPVLPSKTLKTCMSLRNGKGG